MILSYEKPLQILHFTNSTVYKVFNIVLILLTISRKRQKSTNDFFLTSAFHICIYVYRYFSDFEIHLSMFVTKVQILLQKTMTQTIALSISIPIKAVVLDSSQCIMFFCSLSVNPTICLEAEWRHGTVVIVLLKPQGRLARRGGQPRRETLNCFKAENILY